MSRVSISWALFGDACCLCKEALCDPRVCLDLPSQLRIEKPSRQSRCFFAHWLFIRSLMLRLGCACTCFRYRFCFRLRCHRWFRSKLAFYQARCCRPDLSDLIHVTLRSKSCATTWFQDIQSSRLLPSYLNPQIWDCSCLWSGHCYQV